MWGLDGVVEFTAASFMQGDGSDVFNFFFTVVMAVGLIGWGIGLLCQIISKS